MAFETTLVPRLPYSLAASVRMRSDATRVFRDGVLTLVYERAGEPVRARVWQRADATLGITIESDNPSAALEHVRFMLAVDDDCSEFLARFGDDPLLAEPIRNHRGLRPLRVATVTHALLKAVCGQLIQAKAARLLEARLLRLSSQPYRGLHLPPTRSTFARFAPAELERHGLASRKALALIRLSRELDLERLRAVPTAQVARRIERERGLGPWSAAMVALHGLGRFDLGLVGDLGLIKICSALRGRWADADDTRELLEPYGEWAGLASVYLLASTGRAYGDRPRGRGRASRFDAAAIAICPSRALGDTPPISGAASAGIGIATKPTRHTRVVPSDSGDSNDALARDQTDEHKSTESTSSSTTTSGRRSPCSCGSGGAGLCRRHRRVQRL